MAESTHLYAGEPDGRKAREPIQTSRFRPQYRPLSEDEKFLHDEMKKKATELEACFCQVYPGREVAIAFTKLEEAIMWAVKGLRASPPARVSGETRSPPAG